MEDPLVVPSKRNEYKGEWSRFYILIMFAIVNCNQCLAWFTFSSVDPDKIRDYFGANLSDSAIKWLLNWGPIMGVVCFPYQTHVLSKPKGLSRCIVIGTMLVLLGNVVRSIPLLCNESFRKSDAAFGMYHLGQAAIAAGGPFIMGSVSRLSCVWFLQNERTIATAIAQTANGLGTTLGFLIGPLFADDLNSLFWISLVAAVIPAVAFVLYCPERPRYAPSSAAEADANSLLTSSQQEDVSAVSAWIESVRRSAKHPSYVTLVLSAGVLAGANSAWQGVLQDTLTPVGYTDSQVGYMGFANGLTGNLAAILGGYIVDRVFVKRMKAGIIVGVFGIFVTSMIFLVSVPCFLYDVAPMPTSLATLIMMMALNGLFYGITSPLFYELSAELIYPQKEGLSAGTLVFVLNAVTMVVIGIDAILSYRYINFIYGIIIGLLFLVLLTVKEEYRRPRNKGDSAEDGSV